MAVSAPPESQLAQLAGMTTISIDTGDLSVIEEFASTGLITDATTNPLFVAQAGTSGDPRYIAFVDKAIAYAEERRGKRRGLFGPVAGDEEVLELARELARAAAEREGVERLRDRRLGERARARRERPRRALEARARGDDGSGARDD